MFVFLTLKVLTKKRKVGSRMTDEFDEGLPHSLTNNGMGGDDVRSGEKREKNSNSHDFEGLQHHVFPTKSGQPFIPN